MTNTRDMTALELLEAHSKAQQEVIERLQAELAGARNQLRVMAALTDAKSTTWRDPNGDAVTRSRLTDSELETMLHKGIYSLTNGAYWCRDLNALGKRAAEEIIALRRASNAPEPGMSLLDAALSALRKLADRDIANADLGPALREADAVIARAAQKSGEQA